MGHSVKCAQKKYCMKLTTFSRKLPNDLFASISLPCLEPPIEKEGGK